jgi:hypothetical protein
LHEHVDSEEHAQGPKEAHYLLSIVLLQLLLLLNIAECVWLLLSRWSTMFKIAILPVEKLKTKLFLINRLAIEFDLKVPLATACWR